MSTNNLPSTVSVAARSWNEEKYSLFFYGTLLHPAVLRRVIGHDGQGLYYQPAMLFDYTRHHIKGEDYPGILPWDRAKSLFVDPSGAQPSLEPAPSDRNVRGSLVSGFSRVDVELLDVFEGDEYERDLVTVVPLAAQQPLNVAAEDDGIVFDPVILPSKDHASELEKKAHVYVWNKSLDLLQPETWSYQTFIQDNLHKWVGGEVSRLDYMDVDTRRAAIERLAAEQSSAPEVPVVVDNSANSKASDTSIVPKVAANQSDYVFGHDMLQYFCFDKGFVNLNHGAFGSTPRPVMEAAHEISMRIEGNPDMYHRIHLVEEMAKVRTRLAKFVNADVSDLVLVPNATSGINTVLHNFQWKPDDILVKFNTTYGAISKTLQRYADAAPHPVLQMITLTFPTTPEAIVSLFRTHIENLQRKPGANVVAIIDGIISVPGAHLPWEEMVKICKEHNVYSLIDGAHMIGQIPVDLKQADPDFLVTNCHKWLYVKRPCAALYVPKRNQQMMRWTFPISVGYVSPPGEVKFAEQFEWVGTIDYAEFMSITAALDFREKIGGEQKIQEYCYRLAREGGMKMAEILGTELMDQRNEFTACMVDVLLPFPEDELKKHPAHIGLMMQEKLLLEWHCIIAIYIHDGRLWTRASAQVWLEVSDFEYVAKALASVCQEFLSSKDLTSMQLRDGTTKPTTR